MRTIKTFLTAAAAFFIAALISRSGSAQETLYPAGYDIECEYTYEPNNFNQAGSVLVNWAVVNNEDFSLSGLYFTDNLPAGLNVESYKISRDGIPVQAYYSGPREDHLMEGYDTYRWVVDFPDESDEIGKILQPGQTLKLQYRITAENPGNYILPFHTVCFFGDGTGIFTVADTVFIPPAGQEIPALGEWAMVIMSLLLLAGATVSVIGKSMKASAATCRLNHPDSS